MPTPYVIGIKSAAKGEYIKNYPGAVVNYVSVKFLNAGTADIYDFVSAYYYIIFLTVFLNLLYLFFKFLFL